MEYYVGYVTKTLEKMKKALYAQYIFCGRNQEVYEHFCVICQELEKRKKGTDTEC